MTIPALEKTDLGKSQFCRTNHFNVFKCLHYLKIGSKGEDSSMLYDLIYWYTWYTCTLSTAVIHINHSTENIISYLIFTSYVSSCEQG